VEERLEELKSFAESTDLNTVSYQDENIGFITAGVAYLYVRESYPQASLLKLGFVHPFCDQKIRDFASRVGELYVVEELDPFLEEHCKALGLTVKAKHPSFRIGELRPESIPDLVAGGRKDLNRPPVRKPVLCPGCPHRFVFNSLKKRKAVVTGDIGCYTLAATPPMATMHTTICMGAGVTVHEGFQRALDAANRSNAASGVAERSNGGARPQVVGVVGDSTFVHSGITGLVNAAYNGVKGLLIILDNGTTAMTGGQNHPATGRTIRNSETKRLSLEGICRAAGADTVDVIDPHEYEQMDELIGSRLAEDSLAVIIARSPCRLLEGGRNPAPEYHEDLCRSCGLCLKIDCPAIEEREDGKISIDRELCAGCYLCVEVCPFEALTVGAEQT